MQQMAQTVQATQNQCNTRFNRNEVQINALVDAQATDSTLIAQLDARMAQLESALHVRDTTTFTPATLPDDSWDRRPDPRVVCVSSPRPVPKDAVMFALKPHLDEHFKPTDYSLQGPPLSKDFTLQFNGDTGGASLRASKFIKSLMSFPTPGGPPSYERIFVPYLREQSQLYIGPDKSPKQRKTEYHIKKLGDLLKEMYPSIPDVFVSRRDGNIKSLRVSLCRIDVSPSPALTKIFWNPQLRAQHSIVAAHVTERFNAAVSRPAESIDWSLV